MVLTRRDPGVVRALLAATVFLVLPASAFAQEVGVKGGINFASLTPEEDEDPVRSRRRGFVGGAWVRIATTSRLSFQAESLFSEKGVRFDGTPLGLDGDVDVRIRYVEIPLLARAEFGPIDSATRLFVTAGAAPALKLSARATLVFEGEERTQDLEDATESFDVGLVGGVGVAFGGVLVEARYTHGLMKTNTDDNDPEDRIENRVFSVTVGLRLR